MRPQSSSRRPRSLLRVLALSCSLLVAAHTAPCQGNSADAPRPSAAPSRAVQDPVQRAALLALLDELETRRADLAAARAAVAGAADPQAQLQRVRELEAAVQETEGKFGSLVVGTDAREFDEPVSDTFDLTSELQRLLQPLVQQMKDATAAPREIEEMRSRLASLGERLDIARRAKGRAEQALAALTATDADAERLRAQITRTRDGWDARIRGIDQQRTVLRAELDNRLAARTSLVDSATQALDSFVRTRGLNLLLAALAFAIVFVSLRFVHRRVQRLGRARDERSFPARLVDVLLHVLVVIAAVGATLATLYAMSDWLLLAVALIFLLGAGWAAIKALPQYFEQVRLMLNLGAVREGERIVLDGLPWRVEALKIYSVLVNPELQGGTLRIPLRDLAGKCSRPMHRDEPWFPCRAGDVVLLSDGVRGKVLVQTPEVVVLSHFGAERSYATAAFLEQSPRNLSRGFTIDVVFGVDYEHQANATRDIPQRMAERLRAELPKTVDAKAIKSVVVEFRAAGASSLDLLALVEVDGAAALQYGAIQRAVSRILTDACTENGWVIPFTQLTVHQAAS